MRIRAVTQSGSVLLDQTFEPNKTIILGRKVPSDGVILDAMVSGAHLEMTSNNGKVAVRDLNTANGTHYNGKKIMDEILPVPCKIILGGSVTVEVSDDAGEITQTHILANKPWEKAWHHLTHLSSRRIVLTSFAVMLVYFLLNWSLLGAKPVYSAIYTVGLTLGVFLISLIFSALLAVPGWLFRGSYNVRPLFVAFTASVILVLFGKEILLPLGFASRLGMMWKLLHVPLLFLSSFCFLFTAMMTTFTHKWGRGITVTAMVLALLGAVSSARNDVFMERSKYLTRVFEMRDANLVPILGGPAVSPAQLGADLSSLEAEFDKDRKTER